MSIKTFKEDTHPITGADIEPTLRHLAPIVGIAYESVRDKNGKITKYGLEDSTLGTSSKSNAGDFGRHDTIGDIDIVIDESKYDSDKFISRLVKKLGPENIGKPVNGGITIPTKVPVGGVEGANLVEVDFVIGNPELLKFTHHSPDPENLSEYNGIARNEMMRAILQDSRRQVRDPETKEIMALVGPSYFLDKGFIQEWRHFPMKEDGSGRQSVNRPISRGEFAETYPDHVGKEKELMLTSPKDMMEHMFPKANTKIEEYDSFESIRDLVIEHKPDRAESIFNLFAQGMHRKGQTIPAGLVVESRQMAEKAKVLTEVRQVSMNRVMESVAKRGTFEDFRKSCLDTMTSSRQLDHFTKPNASADKMPMEGMTYLINKCGLMNEWHDLNKKDYGTNYHHKVADFGAFYEDVCELVGEETFFFVAEHYGLKITPDSFCNSLIEMEYEG